MVLVKSLSSMKIKIYQPYIGINTKPIKPIEVELSGKIATHFEITEEDYLYPTKQIFSYKLDNTYKKELKKLKLNHKFIFYMQKMKMMMDH